MCIYIHDRFLLNVIAERFSSKTVDYDCGDPFCSDVAFEGALP